MIVYLLSVYKLNEDPLIEEINLHQDFITLFEESDFWKHDPNYPHKITSLEEYEFIFQNENTKLKYPYGRFDFYVECFSE